MPIVSVNFLCQKIIKLVFISKKAPFNVIPTKKVIQFSKVAIHLKETFFRS